MQKEQADGDFQNLVFCIMIERDCDLQTAVDVLSEMLAQRVADYARFKAQLPSFGAEVDAELARYNKAIEQYTQGTVVWYYYSPRKSACFHPPNRRGDAADTFCQATSAARTSQTSPRSLYQCTSARSPRPTSPPHPPRTLQLPPQPSR